MEILRDSLPAEDWGEMQMHKTTDYLNIELQHGPRVLSFVGFEFVEILFGSWFVFILYPLVVSCFSCLSTLVFKLWLFCIVSCYFSSLSPLCVFVLKSWLCVSSFFQFYFVSLSLISFTFFLFPSCFRSLVKPSYLMFVHVCVFNYLFLFCNCFVIFCFWTWITKNSSIQMFRYLKATDTVFALR